MSEQAVHVQFDHTQEDWSQFWIFEKQLEKAVDDSGLGEYDGNELALDCSNGTLFLYGPDADKLLAVVRPILQAATFMKNAVVTLRYGPAHKEGVRTTTVRLGLPH